MLIYDAYYNTCIKEYGNGQTQFIFYDVPVKYGNQNRNKGVRGQAINKENSIYNSIKRTKSMIYDYAKSNVWEYCITITLNSKKIDRYDYDEISKKFSKLLNNIKSRKASNLIYLFVAEKHKDGAFHYHGLLSSIDGLNLIKTTKKDYMGRTIYNCKDFNLGFTNITKVDDTEKLSNYFTKYITSDLVKDTFNKRRYWISKNVTLPKKNVLILEKKVINSIITQFSDTAYTTIQSYTINNLYSQTITRLHINNNTN